MKSNRWLIGASLLAVPLTLGLSRIGAQEIKPQMEIKKAEISMIRSEIVAPRAVSLSVVSQEFTGSFDSVEESCTAFKNECLKQKVKLEGTPSALLILTEDPTGKDSFKYSIGFTAAKQKVEAPLRTQSFSFGKAVSHVHVGSYSELAAVHGAIRTASKERTKFPVIMKLVNDPKYPVKIPGRGELRRGPNIRTEMLVPIK